MPPHIFLLVAVGAGLIAGYRMAHRAMKQRPPDQEPPEKQPDVAAESPRDLGKLEWDEAAGAYRPPQQ